MIARTEWEQAGYRVGDHTRSPLVDLAALDEIVIHYPGATGPISTLSPITYVQNLQRWSVNRPKPQNHSIGYSFGYWADGTEIELRGYDYRNAANAVPGDRGATNRRTLSLLVIVGRQDPATAAQIAAVRRRRQEINTRTGRLIPSTSHRDLEPTTCPGAGIAAQAAAGMFEPSPIPNPQPKDDPTVPPTCYYTDTRIRGTFALVAGRWIPWLFTLPKGVPHHTGDHAHTREQVLHDQGPAAAELWRERITS